MVGAKGRSDLQRADDALLLAIAKFNPSSAADWQDFADLRRRQIRREEILVGLGYC